MACHRRTEVAPTGAFRIFTACSMIAFVLSMTLALFSSSLPFSLSCAMMHSGCNCVHPFPCISCSCSLLAR